MQDKHTVVLQNIRTFICSQKDEERRKERDGKRQRREVKDDRCRETRSNGKKRPIQKERREEKRSGKHMLAFTSEDSAETHLGVKEVQVLMVTSISHTCENIDCIYRHANTGACIHICSITDPA